MAIKDDGAAAVVVDYRGVPADKASTGGWLGAGLILSTELAERVLVIGISMNLVTYLVGDLHLASANSANIVTNFMGTLNLLGLLGGFLADAKLGRYLTMVAASATAAAGASMLTIATRLTSMRPPACGDALLARHECVQATGGQMALLFAALYTVALGAGGIKANTSGFGTDQFDHADPEEERAMLLFFNRFYFVISLGSLFAVTVLVYVQDHFGRSWGYGISAVTMLIAVSVLVAGTKRYRYRRPQGSPLMAIGRVLWMAWKKRRLALPADDGELFQVADAAARLAHTNEFRCLDKAAIVERGADGEVNADAPAPATVTAVEEAKMVLKLFPIWATSIPFWTVYSQMITFSVEQATYMNRRLGASSVVVPAGSLPVFLFLSILIFTAGNEKFLVPLARRITHNPIGITSLQRVGVGLLLSVAGMAVAAGVERSRRDAANSGGAPLSVFLLAPQFFLVGAGEAFAYVGQLEFFIREAPQRMKSMSTGLFLATVSLGFFLSSALVSLADAATNGDWIRNDFNRGRLDYFYWMLAVVGVVNFSAFVYFASRHEYQTPRAATAGEGAARTEEDDMVEEAVHSIDV